MIAVVFFKQADQRHLSGLADKLIPNAAETILLIELTILHQSDLVLSGKRQVMHGRMTHYKKIICFAVGKYLPIHCRNAGKRLQHPDAKRAGDIALHANHNTTIEKRRKRHLRTHAQQPEEGCYTVYTDPADFNAVAKALEDKGYTFESAQIEMVPQTYQKLEKPEDIANMEKMLDLFEEDDDVQNVWHNWDQD